MSKKYSPERSITLRNVIVSYPVLFEPKVDDNGKLKYSGAFLISDPAQMELARAAERAAAQDLWGEAGLKMLANGDLPSTLRTDPKDIKKRNYPEGTLGYINARSDNQPGVVATYPGPDGKRPAVITDPKAIFAGCKVNVSLNTFPYDRGVKKGVSFGLGNVQLVSSEMPRLDGRKSAEDEFEAALNEEPADTSDLFR